MKKVQAALIMCVLIAVAMVATVALAAPQRNRSGDRVDRSGDRSERMAQMMKKQLGVTDEEWTVIGPRLTKVMTLSRQANARGGMGMMGGRGRRPGGREGGPEGGQRPEGRRQQTGNDSEVQKATEALNTVLEKSDSTTDQINAKLTALRTAKEKAKQELSKAQQELKGVLTLRQEAKLVTMGLLN